MRHHPTQLGWLILALGMVWASPAMAQVPRVDNEQSMLPPQANSKTARLPLDELPPAIRDKVRRVIEQPSLSASGPIEEFAGRPALYYWLLDHPDRAAQAWRRLGAPALDITDRGQGRFGWADQQGSDLIWDTVYRTPEMRIWYAEGRARPGLLLPSLSVRAVVVMRHGQRIDTLGRTRIYHQADLYLQTDNKTAALLARWIGPSAPRLTEQCVVQLEVFFSALTCYLDRHPERAEPLFFGDRPLGWIPPPCTGLAKCEW